VTGDLKRRLLGGLAAASLVNAAMYDSWKMILDPARSATLGFRPTSEACWAALVVCLLAFLAGSLTVAVLGPTAPAGGRVIRDLLLLSTSLLLVNVMRPSAVEVLPSLNAWVRQHGGGYLRVSAAILLLLSLRWRRTLARGYYHLLLILSPFLLITSGRAVAAALSTDFAALDRTVPSLGLAAPRPGLRVVVMIFDEMDFNYAFTSRPGSLALPVLDALRQHAFFATDAHAPARSTVLSIPSYIIGQVADSIISTNPASELVHVAGVTGPRNIASEPGLFADAAALGARSEVVGFHIPYCRLAFARLLDRCTWRPISRGGVLDGPMGLPRAVVRQLAALLLIGNRVAHEDRILYLTHAAIRAASDSSLRLAFLHLPLPHLPPIWNENRGRFTWVQFRVSGYFDNLALADHVLGRILAATERARLMDRTVFVVTSDHPWRFGPIDGIAPGTTIPLLVRFPDGAGMEWAPRFETVRLRSMVRALLGGEVTDLAGLAAWAGRP